MIIGSISENIEIEKRVALTPDIIKKYKSLGLEVYLNKDYASHIGIDDKEYESEGANILANTDDVISKSNAILQMNILSDENLNKLTKEQILIGVLNPYLNDKKLKLAISKNVNCSKYFCATFGSIKVFMPSISRVSEAPASEEIFLLPCLATFIPVEATRSELAVEIFSVFIPSPPVPTISTAFSLFKTFKDFFLIIEAAAVSSSMLSPRTFKDVRNEDISTSDKLPSIMFSKTISASLNVIGPCVAFDNNSLTFSCII